MKLGKHDLSELAEKRRLRLERETGCRVYTFSVQPMIHYTRGTGPIPFVLMDAECKTPGCLHTWNSIPTSELRAHADATDRIAYGDGA